MAPDEASSLGTGGPKRRLAPHCAGLLSYWFCQGGGLQALGLLVARGIVLRPLLRFLPVPLSAFMESVVVVQLVVHARRTRIGNKPLDCCMR